MEDSPHKGKRNITEIDGPTTPPDEADLREAMKAMIKGEMGNVWDRLGKVVKTYLPLVPQ
ncbi:hypothetical protein Pyn_21392 [Prunus yedoensis var. nudiflora]|uniref:Uncharacterized protein n=1 Tax=Prunus yedoensis var. nudiflora TaxID=2094558 RepID=A0A314ZKL3_PRUYE|nr:hypothetical protein Pyn_21392 [Prunus yedoensis var. nudiflora]